MIGVMDAAWGVALLIRASIDDLMGVAESEGRRGGRG